MGANKNLEKQFEIIKGYIYLSKYYGNYFSHKINLKITFEMIIFLPVTNTHTFNNVVSKLILVICIIKTCPFCIISNLDNNGF